MSQDLDLLEPNGARPFAIVQARVEERRMERERIARELHDTLLQGFQGLVLTFGVVMQRIAPGEPREILEKALYRAQETLSEGRDRVMDLRNPVGFRGDLATALNDVAAALAVANPATFTLSEHGARRDLQPVCGEEVLLIAREALANAYRHAAAQRIEAEVEYGVSSLIVRIRDNGVGIDVEVLAGGHKPGHFGLVGMRERAERIGGSLTIESHPGRGCQVALAVAAARAFAAKPDPVSTR